MPSLVKPGEARVRFETADEGFKVAVLIDAESHGSPLLLGLAWIAAGTDRVSWTADDLTHEAYHLVSGRLGVTWGTGERSIVEPDDSFYFPPGETYAIESLGPGDAFLMWSLVPSPGYAGNYQA